MQIPRRRTLHKSFVVALFVLQHGERGVQVVATDHLHLDQRDVLAARRHGSFVGRVALFVMLT